jgi:hypothetical protein
VAKDRTALEELIKANKGVLIRCKKHLVYEFPTGLHFTVSKTPRCPHAYANAISSLKRLLGNRREAEVARK